MRALSSAVGGLYRRQLQDEEQARKDAVEQRAQETHDLSMRESKQQLQQSNEKFQDWQAGAPAREAQRSADVAQAGLTRATSEAEMPYVDQNAKNAADEKTVSLSAQRAQLRNAQLQEQINNINLHLKKLDEQRAQSLNEAQTEDDRAKINADSQRQALDLLSTKGKLQHEATRQVLEAYKTGGGAAGARVWNQMSGNHEPGMESAADIREVGEDGKPWSKKKGGPRYYMPVDKDGSPIVRTGPGGQRNVVKYNADQMDSLYSKPLEKGNLLNTENGYVIVDPITKQASRLTFPDGTPVMGHEQVRIPGLPGTYSGKEAVNLYAKLFPNNDPMNPPPSFQSFLAYGQAAGKMQAAMGGGADASKKLTQQAIDFYKQAGPKPPGDGWVAGKDKAGHYSWARKTADGKWEVYDGSATGDSTENRPSRASEPSARAPAQRRTPEEKAALESRAAEAAKSRSAINELGGASQLQTRRSERQANIEQTSKEARRLAKDGTDEERKRWWVENAQRLRVNDPRTYRDVARTFRQAGMRVNRAAREGGTSPPKQGTLKGATHLDPSIAPKVSGDARPLAPGEYVKNPSGSWSSEITATIPTGEHPELAGGKATVIPTLWLIGGKPTRVSEDRAAELAAKSGLKWRTFSTDAQAERFATNREAKWQKIEPRDASTVEPLWEAGP